MTMSIAPSATAAPAKPAVAFLTLLDKRLEEQAKQKKAWGESFKTREGQDVVAFFYPKDFSPGCTKQAKAFHENYKEFKANKTYLVGISADSDESHKEFARKYGFRFPLISDPKGELRKALGMPTGLMSFITGRATYVITGEGQILHTVRHQFMKMREHMEEALNVVKEHQNKA